MARKEFKFMGKTMSELKEIGITEFGELCPTRTRRSLKRGFTDAQKALLKNIESNAKDIKTHSRDMIILPMMVDKTLRIYNGKNFEAVLILPEMLGHRLGEFSLTRKKVGHSAPGVGATRSSGSVSVK